MDLPAIGTPPFTSPLMMPKRQAWGLYPRIRRVTSTAQESMRWIVSPPWHSFC